MVGTLAKNLPPVNYHVFRPGLTGQRTRIAETATTETRDLRWRENQKEAGGERGIRTPDTF
jgi:hypothetical protein